MIWLAVYVFLGYMFVRNERIYRMRKRMLVDIAHDRPWEWRYDQYDQVSHPRILLRFWVPVRPERFWPDTSFLRPDQ